MNTKKKEYFFWEFLMIGFLSTLVGCAKTEQKPVTVEKKTEKTMVGKTSPQENSDTLHGSEVTAKSSPRESIEDTKLRQLTPPEKWFKESCYKSPTGKGGPMCAVPSGPFFMGCDFKVDTECYSNEYDVKKITTNAFYIDQFEVTVSAYLECVEAGGCDVKGLNSEFSVEDDFSKNSPQCNLNNKTKGMHPVNCIPWENALTYCEWAGKRLPTAAEWEKAARGSSSAIKYTWGNTEETTWSNVRNKGGTVSVGSYEKDKSQYNVYDLTGNVGEWINGWYEDYNSLDEPVAEEYEEQLAPNTYRVVKGGSWYGRFRTARISNRKFQRPENRIVYVGFRCALSFPSKNSE